MAGAAMVLGLGFYSPLATVPYGSVGAERSPSVQALLRHADGRVSQKSSLILEYRNGKLHHRRKLRLLVHALNEEEADITSIRGKLHDENLLIAFVKRLFDWGRDVQKQSTEHLQKFFHELADGSLLISFGAATSTSPNAAHKTKNLPPRLPSRFSKQLPYTLKGAKKQSESHLAQQSAGENVPVQQARKSPARVPSTFSKRSPIIKTSLKHLAHKDGLSSAVTGDLKAPSSHIDHDHGLAFKDVCLEEETSVLINSSESKRLRPRAAFVRKSPIPRTSKTRKRKAAEKKEAFEQVSSTDASSGENPTGHSEHKKAALSKIPEYGSSNEAASHTDKSNPPSKFSRPKAAFVRKSPITQARGGRRKRKPATKNSLPKENEEADEKNVIAGVVVKRTTTFASNNLSDVEDVLLLAAKKDHLTEEEILKHAAEAVTENNEAEQKNVVAEVLVEASTAFVETLVQADELEEISREIVEEAENGWVVSQNSAASKSRRRKVIEKVQTVETDVEMSDDDSVSSNITDEDISDLSVLTLQRLRGIAKSRGLKGYSRLRKAELVELLSQS